MYPATTFFSVDTITGVVNVITDLRNDALSIASYTVSRKHNLVNLLLDYFIWFRIVTQKISSMHCLLSHLPECNRAEFQRPHVLSLSVFQLTVVAFDNAYANNRATADVTIEVIRNENGPIFTPSATYEVTVSEEAALGSLIEVVTAIDRDEGVRGFCFTVHVRFLGICV